MNLRGINLSGSSIDISKCSQPYKFQCLETGDQWEALMEPGTIYGLPLVFMFGAHPRWYEAAYGEGHTINVIPMQLNVQVGIVVERDGRELPKPPQSILEEMFPDDDDEPGAEQWDIHVTNTDQLYMYPLGTKFYVRNGAWNGIVTGNHEERMIYVAETGVTHQLLRGEPTDLHISLDPDTCT